MKASVSVIVPTLDRPAEVEQALASILGQRGIDLREVEVVVINDGGSPVENVVHDARARGLAIQLINHPHRRGLPCARNTGIEHAHGSYIAFLDDDDLFLPDHLATALATLESGIDAVATTCLVAERRIDPGAPVGSIHANTVPWDVAFDPVLLEACNLFPVHAAVLRSPRAGTARFDHRLPAIEDWDFWLRLTREHGYRISRRREPTVIYHRLPAADSMIGTVADNAAAMARFSALVRQMWARWPTSTDRSHRFRLYTSTMYWQVLAQLAAGRLLNPHYYQQSIHALAHAWCEPAAEIDLIQRLTDIITATGENADDRRTA